MIRKAVHPDPVCREESPALRARKAFTFVELLIVVFALVIIAAVVVPQICRAGQKTNDDRLRDTLIYLRTQIAVFKAQHLDVPPGYPQGNPMAYPTESAFAKQMTLYTDTACRVRQRDEIRDPDGPYFLKMPVDAINGLSSIEIVGNNRQIPQPDGKTGWIYKPQTQEIIANVVGNDASGNPYTHY